MIYEYELEHDVDNRTELFKCNIEIDVDGQEYKPATKHEPEQQEEVELTVSNIDKVYKWLPTLEGWQRCNSPEGFKKAVEDHINKDAEFIKQVLADLEEYHAEY